MIRFILGSHGTMAGGMKQSLEILLGSAENVTTVNAYVDETNITEEFERIFRSIPDEDQVIMLSDLYGGSVNQMMYGWLKRPNTKLIAGVNLALVLELTAAAAAEEQFTDEMIREKIEGARAMMQQVALDEKEETEEEDFF